MGQFVVHSFHTGLPLDIEANKVSAISKHLLSMDGDEPRTQIDMRNTNLYMVSESVETVIDLRREARDP